MGTKVGAKSDQGKDSRLSGLPQQRRGTSVCLGTSTKPKGEGEKEGGRSSLLLGSEHQGGGVRIWLLSQVTSSWAMSVVPYCLPCYTCVPFASSLTVPRAAPNRPLLPSPPTIPSNRVR